LFDEARHWWHSFGNWKPALKAGGADASLCLRLAGAGDGEGRQLDRQAVRRTASRISSSPLPSPNACTRFSWKFPGPIIADHLGTSMENRVPCTRRAQSEGLIGLRARKTVRFIDEKGLSQIQEGRVSSSRSPEPTVGGAAPSLARGMDLAEARFLIALRAGPKNPLRTGVAACQLGTRVKHLLANELRPDRLNFYGPPVGTIAQRGGACRAEAS